MSIDRNDPEQDRLCRNEYQRKWREAHKEEINRKIRDKTRNKPAAPGVKGRGKQDTGWLDAAYCTENQYAEEISWGIDKEKLRRSIEE